MCSESGAIMGGTTHRLPPGVSWGDITLIGLLAGIGVTFFIAMHAFNDEALPGAAKLGVLLGSLVTAVLGLAWGIMYRRSCQSA
ncbi:Na antiporter NhaA [Pseudomonas cichorii]|nr:Na antiporter NhaA [Pseudomonas cichorii]